MKLELRNATYAFADDQDPVLRDVSLSVPSGDVVSVIGPSGAGKTTLLRLAALFDRPDDGTITLDGVDPWVASDRQRLELRRRVGIVFQSASLFDASVARNVDAGLRVRSSWRERFAAGARRTVPDLLVPSPAPDDRVLDALSLVGLADARDRDARSLSGGEAQRVAFARALAYDPDFLVLDEPTSDLDPRNTAILERAIDRARERGLGVLLATHDMHQAERVSDRVGFLLDGKLVEVGPPERLFDSPTDARTERFVEGDLLYDEEPSDETASGEARESPPDASSS